MIKESMTKNIVPISDLRRKFGDIEAALPHVDYFILTKKGKPFATLSATLETKKAVTKKFAGAFKNVGLDDDSVWKKILARTSRKASIKL